MGLTNAARDLLVPAITGTALGTPFNSTNSRIGVGNSTAVFAVGQTDLQGASKFRQLVSGAPVTSSPTIQFAATFATGDANFTWEEWGVFNAASGGSMLNRFVQALGTKSSAQSWAFTVTLTFVPS